MAMAELAPRQRAQDLEALSLSATCWQMLGLLVSQDPHNTHCGPRHQIVGVSRGQDWLGGGSHFCQTTLKCLFCTYEGLKGKKQDFASSLTELCTPSPSCLLDTPTIPYLGPVVCIIRHFMTQETVGGRQAQCLKNACACHLDDNDVTAVPWYCNCVSNGVWGVSLFGGCPMQYATVDSR